MDLAGLREALGKRPFEPFSICLADGRSMAVNHPEFVAVGTRRVIVMHEDDSWTTLEPLLIVSLDYASPKKNGNGKRGRKR
jgi:hypothetical protein